MNEQELFAQNDVFNEETNSLVRRIEGDILIIFYYLGAHYKKLQN